MKCWICGDIANTREHLLKASDLRSHYNKVTPEKPIYYHSDAQRNVPLQSVKDKRLVCKAKICAKCNNERTQPYDRAWEAFSNYTRKNWNKFNHKNKIDLSKIFPGTTKKQALNIHLYFVKLFGCRIEENKVPIDLSGFSESLLQGKAHEKVGISVLETPEYSIFKLTSLTEIHAVNKGNETIGAAWIYTIGPISIRVGYAVTSIKDLRWPNIWHPSKKGKIIKIGKM